MRGHHRSVKSGVVAHCRHADAAAAYAVAALACAEVGTATSRQLSLFGGSGGRSRSCLCPGLLIEQRAPGLSHFRLHGRQLGAVRRDGV